MCSVIFVYFHNYKVAQCEMSKRYFWNVNLCLSKWVTNFRWFFCIKIEHKRVLFYTIRIKSLKLNTLGSSSVSILLLRNPFRRKNFFFISKIFFSEIKIDFKEKNGLKKVFKKRIKNSVYFESSFYHNHHWISSGVSKNIFLSQNFNKIVVKLPLNSSLEIHLWHFNENRINSD